MFKTLRQLSAGAALLPLVLAACGGHEPADLNRQIEGGQANKALATLQDKLSASPDDAVYLALALKANLYRCAETDCPKSNPGQLGTVETLSAKVPGPVELDKDLSISPADMFGHAAGVMAANPNGPESLLALFQKTPATLRPATINAAFAAARDDLRQRRTEPALMVLRNLSHARALPEAAQDWAIIAGGLASRDPSRTESGVIALRSQQKNGPLLTDALKILPYAVLADAGSIPALSTSLISTTSGWQLPLLLDAPALGHVAAEVNHLRQPENLKVFVAGTITPLTSSTTALSSPDATAQLMLMRLSLALNPNQPELWRTFLQLATTAMAQTGDLTLLAGPGAPSQPPSDIQDNYVSTLFRAVEGQAAKGAPLLPLLKQLDLLKLDKSAQVRLEKMVQAGLETAAASRKAEDVVAYATFKPEVARNNRQNVIPLVVETIRDDLKNQRFAHATALADLVNNQLQIDFNYDALVLQEFEDHGKAELLDKLSADTPETLLQPADAAALDLGPLWAYMKEHFAEEPAVLDQQLKNLIASARGMYGTPTALYRVYAQFGDTSFPPAQRQAYLLAAIQKSIIDDDRLSGPEVTDTAWRLARIHEGLSLAPLIENALGRSQSLEDSRNLWTQSPAPIRQTITTVRPQFAALMRGIDAWNGGRRSKAAAEFSNLSGAGASQYADQLGPYLESLRDHLIQFSGLYAAASPTAAVPTAMIKVEAPALSGSGTLSTLRLTLLGKLGTASETDKSTLATSHGVVRKVTLDLPVDFDTGTIPLSAGDKETHSSPSPFEESFGDITRMGWSSDGSILTITARGAAPATYTKVVENPSAPLYPQGTYMVEKQLSASNGQTDLLLPPGALISISTDREPTTAVKGTGQPIGTFYTVTGQLRHPAMAKPQDITGYYEADKHTLNFTYTSPLKQGDTAKAALRCEVIAHALLCGAHHTHSNREQFTHRVLAMQTKESATAQDAAWTAASANTLKAWKALKPDMLLKSGAGDALPDGAAAAAVLGAACPA